MNHIPQVVCVNKKYTFINTYGTPFTNYISVGKFLLYCSMGNTFRRTVYYDEFDPVYYNAPEEKVSYGDNEDIEREFRECEMILSKGDWDSIRNGTILDIFNEHSMLYVKVHIQYNTTIFLILNRIRFLIKINCLKRAKALITRLKMILSPMLTDQERVSYIINLEPIGFAIQYLNNHKRRYMRRFMREKIDEL